MANYKGGEVDDYSDVSLIAHRVLSAIERLRQQNYLDEYGRYACKEAIHLLDKAVEGKKLVENFQFKRGSLELSSIYRITLKVIKNLYPKHTKSNKLDQIVAKIKKDLEDIMENNVDTEKVEHGYNFFKTLDKVVTLESSGPIEEVLTISVNERFSLPY